MFTFGWLEPVSGIVFCFQFVKDEEWVGNIISKKLTAFAFCWLQGIPSELLLPIFLLITHQSDKKKMGALGFSKSAQQLKLLLPGAFV